MTGKPYGKLTAEQIELFSKLVQDTRDLAPSLEEFFREADLDQLITILSDDFTWVHFYEMSFSKHVTQAVLIMNWQDVLKNAVESGDPQQAFFDFINHPESDQDWDGGYQNLFNKEHLFGLGVSIVRTLKSIMIYQKSLSTLIEDVRQGNDKSLFHAVSIDRSVLACTPVRRRISLAEMRGDKKFFQSLAKAMRGPSGKHWVSQEALRFMMFAIVDCGVEKLSSEHLESLFVDRLGLYSKQPGAQKNLYELFLKTKKQNRRNHRK